MINYDKLDAEILLTMYYGKRDEFYDDLYSIIKYKEKFYVVLKYLPFGFYLLETNYFEFKRVSLCKFEIITKEINLDDLKYYKLSKLEKLIISCIVDSNNKYLNQNLPIELKNKLIGEL